MSAVWTTLIVCFLIVRLIYGFKTIFGSIGVSSYIRYFEFIAAPGMILAALNLPPLTKLLSWKPFFYLGGLSTAIYYVHNNIMQDYAILNHLAGEPISFSAWPIFLIVIVSMVPFAMLYRFAEGKVKGAARKIKKPKVNEEIRA